MSKTFNINASDVVEFTNKLEKMHRSSLPVSIRGALNDVAFDVKQYTLQKEFEDNFTIRKKTFLSSHSRAIKSKNTFDIEQMESSIGIIRGKSKSGDQLKFQERGGTIQNRGAVPTKEVRVGESSSRLIKKSLYYTKFKTSKKGIVERNKNRTIIKTDRSLLRVQKGGIWKTLYRIKERVKITKDPFLEPAALKSLKKLPQFFINQAKKRLK